MYQNAKIYTIRSHSRPDLVYVGSTCSSLPQRIYEHRSDFKLWKNGKRNYISSFALIELEDHYIEFVESCPCSNKMELRRREGEVIRSMDCVNKNIAGRNKQEYYKDNKEHMTNYFKKYYENNKEQILTKHKEKITCECGAIVSQMNSKHRKTKKHLSSLVQT